MNDQLIKDYISKIQKGEILDVTFVPIEVRNHPKIARTERKVGLRTTKYSGFDVIRQNFFVVENIRKLRFGEIFYHEQRIVFDTFDAYYAFLDGDIYEKSCYYSFYFDEALVRKYSIDTSKINNESFVQENVSSIVPMVYMNNMKSYDEKEIQKKKTIQWIKKYNGCETVEELMKVDKNHSKSQENC